MYIYILIGILIIILVIDIFERRKLFNKEDILTNKVIKKYKEDLELRFEAFEKENNQKKESLTHELDVLGAQLDAARTNTDQAIAQYQQTREAQERAGAEYVRTSTEKNNEEIHRYFDNEVNNYRLSTSHILETIREDAQKELKEYLASNEELAQKKRMEINELDRVIKDFKEKRDAINSEIMRQRKIEEEQNFYRICLPENAKEDIDYLISIINNFHNKEIIYKLIWSEYIQGPFKEMLNRVLEGKEIKNVIYMIKNIKTGEIYIGKTSALVSKRWTEHIKTSLNIGTISRTKIHKALFNNWDNFSFSIVEKVSEDAKLGEREKYYINFYNSDTYGYNIKSGG